MAFFNFIETFFFISLGITFVLVLLLVYHFKQRVSGLEHKCDTMFEIINDMVKQLNTIRIQNNVPFMNVFNPLSKTIPEIQHFINETIDMNDNKTNIDEESEEDSDESEDEGDSEHEEESEEEDDEEESEDSDDYDEEEDENDNEDGDSIKIINVNIKEPNEITELSVEELTENNDVDVDVDSSETEPLEPVNIENINVEKIMPLDDEYIIEPTEETESVKEQDKKEAEKEVYKKMSMSALKTLVISKGLCSDASKLKKQDLLKLLENIEE
jgi:hypothetical protein